MGKATGFIDYQRAEQNHINPLERINSYNEFTLPLSTEERKVQASRCMNCGVPFCSTGSKINNIVIGCPLANNIPEVNDLIYRGLYEDAYKYLTMTAPFPEFTGRVCPALCEQACVNKVNYTSTTNKDNELFIIENAFKEGYVKTKPIKRNGKKVCVIGSGPSGLSAAYYLNEYGFDVTVYEKNDRPGGLLMYGIPNMKLDKSIVLRRIKLMEESGIKFILNTDMNCFELIKDKYDAICFAGGTNKPRDLVINNRDAKNIHYALDYLTANTKAILSNTTSTINAKDKDVIIIGGGDTGNDCVATALRQGAKSIKEVEIMPEPPIEAKWPFLMKTKKMDYATEEHIAKFGFDQRIYNTRASKVTVNENNEVAEIELVQVKWEGRTPIDIPETKQTYKADLILISMGFIGNTSPLKDIKDPKLFICGDALTGQSLVVHAINSGKNCAKQINNYLRNYIY